MSLLGRIHIRTLTLAIALLAGFSGALMAEEPAGPVSPDRVERIRRLIAALGSDSYPEREWAARDLYDLGRAAIEPLEYAAKSEDSEVRLRATQLLFAMRGRGFMGINLQEEQAHNAPLADDDSDDPSHMGPYTPPVVKVMGIANARDYQLTKPFPAELAGLTTADKVLEINNRPVNGVRDLMREVITIGPARLAIALIDRDGRKLRVPLMLTRNPMIHDNPAIDLERELESQASDPSGKSKLNVLEQPAQSVKPANDPPQLPTEPIRPIAAKDPSTPAKDAAQAADTEKNEKKEETPVKK